MLSLRQRLIIWQMGFFVTALVSFAAISYSFLAVGMESGIDETLRERAEHVSEALQEVPNRGFDMIDSATDDFTQLGVYVQVLKPDGEVVARSYNIGPHSLPVDQAVIDQVLGGDTPYTTTTLNDQQIRLYYQPIIRDGIPVGVVQVGQSLQELTETLLRLKALYMIGIVVTLLLGTGISLFLLQLSLRPIVEISRTATFISESVDLKARLQYRNVGDEIGQLMHAFNLMMERLETVVDYQRRFIADTAHELRTPLATIRGNADLLVRFGQNAERRNLAIAGIKQETDRTTRLVTNLLLIAQADAGLVMVPTPLELDEILLSVYEQLIFLPGKTRVVLKRCDSIKVMGDKDRLKQVILNLVDNALRHTDPSGRVVLSLCSDERTAQLTVSDTGTGIAEADLPHIFDRYYKGSGKSSGSGLGLSIVKWFVAEHSGEVSVESRLGYGTTFTISLPTLREKE
jgi:signal transduction histidine kinase